MITKRHRTVILHQIHHSTTADFPKQATYNLNRQYFRWNLGMTPDLRRLSVIDLD